MGKEDKNKYGLSYADIVHVIFHSYICHYKVLYQTHGLESSVKIDLDTIAIKQMKLVNCYKYSSPL